MMNNEATSKEIKAELTALRAELWRAAWTLQITILVCAVLVIVYLGD